MLELKETLGDSYFLRFLVSFVLRSNKIGIQLFTPPYSVVRSESIESLNSSILIYPFINDGKSPSDYYSMFDKARTFHT